MARSPVRGPRRCAAGSHVAGVPVVAVVAVALAVSLCTSVIAIDPWLATEWTALVYSWLTGLPAGGWSTGSLYGLAFAPLLGLAASGDVSSDIEQLIEGVRDLASGDGDAEFALDRDDELGELSEELDQLAAQVEERDDHHEEYEAYTEAMLDAIDDVFYVLDKEGQHRRWNQAICDVTGYSDDELAEMHPLDFFEGEDRDRMAASMEEVFESGSARVEADFRTKDGDAIPYEFTASRVEAPDGTPIVAGIGRNVAHRREQERDRAESERYRRKLYEATTDPTLDDEETFERLLELGRERLGVDNGHVVEIDPENARHEVRRSSGAPVVEAGTVTELDETFCGETLEADGVLAVSDAAEEGWESHPAYERWGIECYVGAELYVRDELFGTLCFVDDDPHEQQFTPAEKTFVDLIARWVSQYYERREQEREREESERYRRELYEITSDGTLDSETKVRRLLELGCERLDVECGLVTRIDEETGDYEIQWAEGTDFVTEGVVTDVSKTYCREVIESEDILGLSDTSGYRLANPGEGHDAWGIECYIGGRIELDGEIYGTLCFVDPEPRSEPFSTMEKTFVDLMSRWIGHEFERQAHTRELRSKERAMEAAPVGITVADATQPDNPLVYANEAFESLTGYGPEEYLGRNCRFLQGEDTDQESVDRMREAIDAEEQVSVELRNYRADGSEFWNRVNIAPVENADGEVTEFVGFQQDVTERREAQERLAAMTESVHRLESAETEVQIAETVCSIVDEVLEESLCMLWQYDADADALVPLGGTDEAEVVAESLNGSDPVVLPASNAEMEIVREGETRIVEDYASLDRASYPDAPLGTILKVPMGGDGLLAVGYPDVREVDSTTRELVEVLGKHAQASLDRVERAKDLARYKEFTDDVMNSIEDLFYVLDSDGRFERWNETVLEVTGYSEAELVDLDALDLVVEEDRPAIAAAIGATFEEGSARAEASIVTKDGDELPYEFQAAALEDPDGNRVLVGVGRDISDRRERERQLEALVENTTDPIYIKDSDGAYQFVNRAFASYFETTPMEADGKTDDELFQDETVEEITAHDQIVLEEGETVTEEVVRPIDGEEHVFLDNKYPYRDEAGDVVGVMGISRDITERKEREEELSRLISSIPGMVYRAHNAPEWPMEFASDGAADLTGYDAEQLESGEVNWGEDVLDDPSEELWEIVQEAIDAREPFRVTYPIRTAEGERRWLKEQGRGVYDEEGSLQFLEGVIIDVTERVEYERKLEARSVAMEESIDGISILDDDETYSFVNQAHAEIYGYDDPDAFLGETWQLCYTDDEIQRIEDEVFPTLREAGSWRGEAEGQRADGSTFPQELSLTRLEDGRLICVVRDVTERRERERELRETRDRLAEHNRTLRQLYEISADRELSFDEKMQELLELGRERLGTAGAFLSEIDEAANEFEFVHAAGTIGAINPGVIAPYSETYCRRVVGENELFEVTDAPAEGWLDDPAYERWGLDGYVGATVTVEGELAGTLSFVDEAPLDEKLTEDQRTFVELASEWVSYELERRERERNLAEYKEFTGKILDAIDDVFYIFDAEGSLVRWNESLPAVTGYSDAEIAEMHATDFFAAEDVDAISDAVEEVLESGDTIVEAPFLTKEGESIPHEFIATRVEDPDGAVMGAGVGRDVTERKERERELERTTDLLARVESMADIGGYSVDFSGEPPYDAEWTENLYEIFELPSETEPPTSEEILEFYHPADRDQYNEIVQAALESGADWDEELRIVTAEGRVRWVRDIGHAVTEDGAVVEIRGSIQDITEPKEYQRELERNRALLQQAQRVADIGGWELDLREEPPEMTWTEELYDIHGVERDAEIDLDRAMELYHPDDREQLRETVETAIEEAEPYDLEARVLDENGGDRWIRAIAEPVLEDDEVVALRGSIQDVTDVKRREAELERARDMLQQAEHMGGVGGWELDVSEAPYEGIATEAFFDIFDIEARDSMELETIFDYVHPDEEDWVQAEIRRGIESGEPFSLENRIVTGGGAVRWVRLVAEPVEDAELYRGAVLDVTEQKQRELIMEALHETARGLLQTQTPEEVAELAIDTAEDVLDISCTAVYLLDDDSGRLEPVAYSHDFEEVCGGPYPSSSSEADPLLWEAYVAESATGLSGSSTAETGIFDEPVEEGLYVPIGDHGVFVVASDQHRIEHGTRRIAETLVATMEAALHRLDSETDLREREAELAAQNRRLRRQIQINEIIRTVDQSLIGASSREEIETAVCERLTEGDDVAFAWIGSLDSAGDTVVPRAWSGESHDYLDAISLGTGRPVADPAIQTATTGEPTVVESVVQAVKSEEWRKHALVSNFSSVVAVPITFDGYTYGVLSVYGTEPDQFGDLERAVFEELGESIANSINAVETRQALYADAFVELTVHLEESEDFLARVARETGGTVDYVGLGTHSEDESRVFFEVSDADPDEVESMLDATVSVEGYRLIADGGEGSSLFEATVAGEVLAAKLVRRGGVPRSMHATTEELEVTVDVPASLDVREFLESLQENHPTAELVSRRDVQRDVETRQELVNSLFEDLTNRQLEVLRTAYFAGFFGWPRESTGEDIADLLDVSQPTVNRHVRHALQRLLEQLFEEEPATIAQAP